MQKNFTKLIAHFLSSRRFIVPVLSLVAMLGTVMYLNAAVGVTVSGTSAYSALAISADNAANSQFPTGGAYTAIGDIVITEELKEDFSSGTGTLTINAPGGWRFNAGITLGVNVSLAPDETGSVSISTGTPRYLNNNATIEIPITVSNTNKRERITISNVRVQAFNGANLPLSGNIILSASGVTVSGLPKSLNALSQVHGAARKLAFVTPPSTVETGAAITPAPQVAIQDQFGNTVTTATNTVTLTRTANSALTGVLTPGTATRADGVVTFTGASINTAGTGYQLVASSSGLTSVTSAAFTVNNPQPIISAVSGCFSVSDPQTTVTITGEKFVSGATVTFGGFSASSVTVNNSTTITAVLPETAFEAPGTKNIVVTNPTPASSNGVSLGFPKQVRPLSVFSIDGPSSICASVSNSNAFSVQTGPNITSYKWKVESGDATIISGETSANPRITFGSTAGKVVISVVEANFCGAPGPAVTKEITVNPLPTAVIETPSATESCVGSPILLTATPVADATYQWYRGTTVLTSATSDNTYSASVTGNYSVVVKYAGTTECAATSNTIAVTIKENPTATITQGATATYCTNGSTVLTSQQIGSEYTYLWHLNGAPLTNETARTLTVSAEGNYTVQVTRNGCSTMSAATTVTELPLPTAEITPASVTEFCAGGSVVLNATPGTGYTYKWFAEGNTTVLDADGSFATSAPGNYYVVVTGSNNCSATSASVEVIVNQPPVATITATGPTDFCAGESVILNAPLAPVGSTYSYAWNLDGGTTVIGTGRSIEAADPGTYTVTVTNTITGCQSTSAGTVVREGSLEFAIFTYTGATEFCEGVSLQLNAILPPVGQTYEYRWVNGAGETVGTERTFTVTATGAYQVVITETSIENDCVKTSDLIQVTVNPQPTASITGGAQSSCAGADNKTTFSVSGTYSGGTAVWSSNNANFIIQNPVYNASTGVATATVVATGSGDGTISLTTSSTVAGCREAAAAVVLNVKPLPSATITPRGETTFCQGGQVILDAPVGVGYTYQWYLNGNPVIGTGNSYTASLAGNYYVVVTNNSCPVQSPVVAVTVNPLPTASISTTTPTTFCSGGAVTLNAVSDIGTNFIWYRNGTEVGTGATYSANVSGSYTLRATVEGTTCSNLSAATVVDVNPTPTATITTTGPTTFCDRSSVTLSAPPAPAGRTYNYQWLNGSVIITGATNQTYQATTSGNYTVRVTDITTSLNCSATTVTPVAVTVNPLPTASISYTGSTTLCSGGSLLLTGNSNTGTSYIWYRDNVQVATTPTYSATQTGSYTVRATNGNGCAGDLSAAVQIMVNPAITGNTIAGTQTVCSGGTIAALGQAQNTVVSGGATPYQYQWQVSTDNSTWNNITIGGTNPSYTPPVQTVTTSTTTYYRRVVRGGGCLSESASVAVTVAPLPTLSFTGALANTNTFYTGQSAINLTALPAGGMFSGPGVSGSVSAGFTFNPCTAKAGTHIITYNYKSPDGAKCSNSITKTVTVNQSTYRAVITANPHPFCRGGGGTTYTAAVYRDVQPGEIIYPYLVNANGVPVDAAGNAIPKGAGSFPVPNPNYPYPDNTPESIKALAFRFFQPVVSDALASRKIDQSLFTYQWGKNDDVDRKSDIYQIKDAGLSSQDYYEVDVMSGSLCTTVSIESNRMYSAVLEGYTVALSAAPNPICKGASVTFTATLGAAFPWSAANLQLNFVLQRGDRILNTTPFTYSGSNTITFTTDASAAGGFVEGDVVFVRFDTNIIPYLPKAEDSNCIGAPTSTPVTINVVVPQAMTGGGAYCAGGAGVPIGLSNSQIGVSYQLLYNGANVGTAVAGTGSAISFGNQTAAGTYTVQPTTASGSACTTFGSVTVYVTPLPIAYDITGGGEYCAGGTGVAIGMSNSQAGIIYKLMRGNVEEATVTRTAAGAFSFGSNFKTGGVYTVVATTVANQPTVAACPVPMNGTATVIVNSLPEMILSSPPACIGSEATVTASVTNGTAPYTYSWTVPQGASNPGNVSTFKTAVAGDYKVMITDGKSCPVSGTTTVVINEPTPQEEPILEVIWTEGNKEWVVNVVEKAPLVEGELGLKASPTITWYRRVSPQTNWGSPVQTSTSTTYTENSPGAGVEIKAVLLNAASCTEYTLTNIGVKPLPVEIIYLTASKQGNNVLLEWATAMEKDNKGFEVQVSKDGLNYRLLTFVPSKNGNTNTKQVYAFTDQENGKDGTRYYRLKQIDNAGTFEFFGPKMVTFGRVASKVIAFPNPFNDEITLDIASETDGEMLIVVNDAVGKQLMQRKVRVEKGFTTEKLKLGADLPRGLYIIKTQIGGYTQFIKMIKE